jgi:hypothetical protein
VEVTLLTTSLLEANLEDPFAHSKTICLECESVLAASAISTLSGGPAPLYQVPLARGDEGRGEGAIPRQGARWSSGPLVTGWIEVFSGKENGRLIDDRRSTQDSPPLTEPRIKKPWV